MANHYDRKSIQELASIVNAGKAAETQNLEAGRKKAAQNKVLQENGLYYKQVDSPYGKLNDEVLKSVADNWANTVYYDLADPEDVQRRNTGKLPKYYDDKYDLDDPYDAWLYENNLPYKAKFNSIYDDKYDAWATDYNKRVEEVNKKLTEQQLVNSLKTDAANALLADPEADRQKIVHDLLTTEEYQPLIDMYYQIIEDEDDPYGYNNIKNFGKEADDTKLTNNDIFSLYEEVMGNDYGVTPENLAKIQKLENEAAEYRKKAASATGRRKQNFERSAAMAEEQAEKLKADGVKYVETEAVTEQPATPQRTGVFGNYFNEQNAATQNKEQLAAQAVAERDGESVAKKRMELIEKRSQLKQAGISPWERARLNADIKTLEDEIAIAEKGAEQVEKYEKLRSNDDFAEKSKVDASIKNDGSREWSTYAYINNLTGQNTEANMAEDYDSYFDYVMGVYGTMDPMAQREQDALRATEYLWNPNNVLNRMTDDEKALYNYIASTQGIVAAQEYVDSLANTELYGREIAANEATGEQLGESGFMGSIASTLLSPMGALESAYAVNDIAKGASPKEIQSNFRQTEYASGSREAITQRIVENTNQPLGFLYGTAMSMAETLMRMPMGKLGLVLAGGSAMAQTMNDALKEGHDVKQALMLGSIAGGIEAITENIGLDNIFKILNGNPIAASGKEFAKIMLAQGGTEAMEEGIANIGNLIADVLINGDENDIKRSVAAYMMEGMSESQAAGRVVADKLLDLLSDTAGGFISGLLFGTGGQAVALTRAGGMDAVAEYRTTLAEAGAVISPETRVAMLDDMKELGISEEDSEAYIKVFDSYGEIPATWATPESVEVVQEATKAIHEAAENARQLNATNKTKVTQSEQRLTSLYTAMNQAIEALKAIDPTDLRSYTKAMQTVNKAVSAYKAAIPVEQAKVNEANTKTEVSKGREQEKVAAAMAVAQQALSADYQAVSERIRAIQDADALKAEADVIKAEAAAKGDTRTQSIVDMMLEDMADPIPADMTIDGVNALIAEAQASGDMAAVEKYSNWLGRIQAQEAIQQNNVDLFDELFGGENGRQDTRQFGGWNTDRMEDSGRRPSIQGNEGEGQRTAKENASSEGTEEGTAGSASQRGISEWTESDREDARLLARAWSNKLSRDGSTARLSESDIRPAENVSTEVKNWFEELEAYLGREFFLFSTDGAAPYGATVGGKAFVRYRNDVSIIRDAAHEAYHIDAKIQKAANKAFKEAMREEEFAEMKAVRAQKLKEQYGANYAEKMSDAELRDEFGADIFGAYMYSIVTGEEMPRPYDISIDTLYAFSEAFDDMYDGSFIDELKEVEAADVSITKAGMMIPDDAPENVGQSVEEEVKFSLYNDDRYMANAISQNDDAVPDDVMEQAKADRTKIANRMIAQSEEMGLPEDNVGNTAVGNSSYGFSQENSTVCIRSIMADEFINAIGEKLGRPLTEEEAIFASQEAATFVENPQCIYCYVAMDRNAFRAFLLKYIEQRDETVGKVGSKADDELYQEFLGGRKPTKQMRERFDGWLKAVRNTTELITPADLASPDAMQRAINRNPELEAQIEDAKKYAQSASWAKKRIPYRAYNNGILKWSDSRVRNLNKMFGMRMYSFSDFSPAFILENMQMITDAAVKKLKVLAYTKDLDFVKIFAPTGANINVSVFGYMQNGMVGEDAMQGAPWEEAKKLRAKHPNVGITFVATNDDLINWALDQEWIDVVIPFHLVRTGKTVADMLKYIDYTSESHDKKTADWIKGNAKEIYPSVHQNDKTKYLAALKENNLSPRFERWVNHPNYMKLVNETRRSSGETPAVQPIFDVDAANASLDKLVKQGGYVQHVGGSLKRMNKLAEQTAQKIQQGGVSRFKEQVNNTFNTRKWVAGQDYIDNIDNINFSSVSPDTGKKAPLTQAQRELKKAMELYKQGVTVAEYAEREDMKSPIMNKLRGLYLKNGNAQGGMLPEEQLKELTKNAAKVKHIAPLRLSNWSPVRVLEQLFRGNDGKTPKERAENYRLGEKGRDATWGYMQKQASDAETYKREASAAIAKAFEGGKKQESILAQMMVEKIVDKEAAKKARFDGEHLIVPVGDGAYIFNNRGRLKYVVDSKTVVAFGKEKVIDKVKFWTEDPAPRVNAADVKVITKGDNILVKAGDDILAQVSNGKQPNVEIADRTAKALNEFYGEALKKQNRSLVENGYKPIPKRENYAPHIGTEARGLESFIDVLRGEAEALPAAIAGMTENFTPGKPWARHAMARTGNYTEFDAIRGFNSYLNSAADVIYMTSVIQRIRQFERHYRGLSESDPSISPKQNSAWVAWLHDYGNELANKKPSFDRGGEELFGRALYTVSEKLTGYFGAATVAGSVSSTMSQFISYLNAIPSIDKRFIHKGLMRMVQNNLSRIAKKGDDGFTEKIPFLNRRINAYEPILTRNYDKFKRMSNKVLGFFFTAADVVCTEAAARAKYDELMSQGFTEEEAITKTDAWCVKVFADRSKGNLPRYFKSKLLKPLVQFQLEVANQMYHFSDMKKQHFGESLEKILKDKEFDDVDWESSEVKKLFSKGTFRDIADKLLYLLLLSLWGGFTRFAKGDDQTWNPYGMAKDFVNDYEDGGLVEAALGLGENVVDNLPYASVITGGGRIPLMGGWDKIVEAWETWHNEDATLEDKWMDTFRAATSFIPGGGQLRKTVEGARAIKKGGYYTDSGSLKYPITEDEYWKTLLFGTSAAMPEDYDWSEYVTGSRLESYNEMVDNGIDPDTAFDIMSGYGSNTIADKAIAIANNDDDLSDEEVDIIAEIMGLKPSGDFDEWAVGQVEKRMADLDKQLEKEKIEQKEYDKQMSAYEIFIEMMMED